MCVTSPGGDPTRLKHDWTSNPEFHIRVHTRTCNSEKLCTESSNCPWQGRVRNTKPKARPLRGSGKQSCLCQTYSIETTLCRIVTYVICGVRITSQFPIKTPLVDTSIKTEFDLSNKGAMSEEFRGCFEENRDINEEMEQLCLTPDQETENDEKLNPGAEAGHALDEGSLRPQIESGLAPTESEMTLEEAKQLCRKLCEKMQAYEEKQRADTKRKRVTTEKLVEEDKRLKSNLMWASLEKGSLLTYLRNPKEKYNCSGNGPDVRTGHVMATRTQAFFSSSLIHDYRLELTHEPQLPFGNEPRVHSKVEVAFNVHNLLQSLLVALDLDQLYAVKRNFLGDDYDVVIVQLPDFFPIGFVKVMLPGAESDVFGTFKDDTMKRQGSGSVSGELFDLLVRLQMVGPKNPVALLTNGNKWQLVTGSKVLPGGNLQTEDAEPSTPPNRLRSGAHGQRGSLRGGKGQATKLLGSVKGIAKPVVALVDKLKSRNREIFVSNSVNVIDGKDKNGMKLGSFLAKVVHLMIRSSNDRFDSQPHGMPIRLIDYAKGEGVSTCDVVRSDNLPLMDESKYPLDEATRFYLLEPLRAKLGSSCYKALAEDGSTCAIEVFRWSDGTIWDHDTVFAQVREECRSWDKSCGDRRCRVRELGSCGEIHLMVPYVEFVESRGYPTSAGSSVSLGYSTLPLFTASKQSGQQVEAGDDDTLTPSQESG
jgi:hypothetical protein